MSLAILSHEAMAFFGLPALILMILLNTISSANGPWLQVVRGQARRWVWLLAPMLSLAISLHFKGTLVQGQAILDSLRFSLPPQSRYLGQAGAIGWIGKPMELFVSEAHEALEMLHSGIPTWVIVIGLVVTGVLLIAAELARRDVDVANFFIVVSLVQLFSMGPLFYLAKDNGRWITITLLTAFILTMESTLPMRLFIRARSIAQVRSFLLAIPGFLPPLGLFFWGAPIGINSFQHIFYSSPAGAPLKAYFLLRMMGLPHPTTWWSLSG
jgi:hypothetical protein